MRINTHLFVYIIFYGGHVNCTGIRNIREIFQSIQIFKSVFIQDIFSLKVQAIAGTLKTNISFSPKDISYLRSVIPSNICLIIVKHYFSSVIVRFDFGGTAQIFFSGKVNFLGAKTFENFKRMINITNELLKNVEQLHSSS